MPARASNCASRYDVGRETADGREEYVDHDADEPDAATDPTTNRECSRITSAFLRKLNKHQPLTEALVQQHGRRRPNQGEVKATGDGSCATGHSTPGM